MLEPWDECATPGSGNSPTDDGGPGLNSPNRPGSPSTTNQDSDQMEELPPEVERLLLDVVADGFTIYCCGPRTAPIALAASYDWGEWVDQLTIWSWDRVTAARFPKLSQMDVFAPETVVWTYEGSAEHTLRALINLVHPQHPDAPAKPYPAPPSLHIPRHRQRPMSIQIPSASQVGAREVRLAGL